jgi:surface protein
LNNWNVSNVTDMGGMFANCHSFNQPLDNWNVSDVIDMSDMFNNCRIFNQPLNSWNVSNVTNMKGMFDGAESFNQPLSNWNISNVENAEVMFRNAKSFNQSINNWNFRAIFNRGIYSGANLMTEEKQASFANYRKFKLKETAKMVGSEFLAVEKGTTSVDPKTKEIIVKKTRRLPPELATNVFDFMGLEKEDAIKAGIYGEHASISRENIIKNRIPSNPGSSASDALGGRTRRRRKHGKRKTIKGRKIKKTRHSKRR